MKTLANSDSIPTVALQAMLEIKGNMQTQLLVYTAEVHNADSAEEFKGQAEDFRTAVNDVLSEEADMAAMYLTDQKKGKPRSLGDDENVELLLEA